MREQVELLERHAGHGTVLGNHTLGVTHALASDFAVADGLAIQGDLPALEFFQQVDAAQQGGLARAAGADQGHHVAALHGQVRKGGAHFALVEEADGKIIGYLTMEDVLEVLVGDIQDEHRKAERGILAYQPGKLLVRGDTPLFKVERLLGVDLDHIEAETLAGLIYDTLKRVPEEEEVLEVEGLRIIIKKMKGPKIVLAKVLLLD